MHGKLDGWWLGGCWAGFAFIVFHTRNKYFSRRLENNLLILSNCIICHGNFVWLITRISNKHSLAHQLRADEMLNFWKRLMNKFNLSNFCWAFKILYNQFGHTYMYMYVYNLFLSKKFFIQANFFFLNRCWKLHSSIP